MTVQLARTLAGALLGALLGVGVLLWTYTRGAEVAFDMNQGAPGIIDGLYDVERAGTETFAWTRRSATVKLPGLDRSVDWSCTIRVRGGRVDPSTLPEVTVSVDGVITAVHQTTNEYQDLVVRLPAAVRTSGSSITLTASNTFVPGPSDPRTLGVMLDRVACNPVADGFVRPPVSVLTAAAVGAGAFGAAFMILGAPMLAWLAGAVLLALAQAVPLGWGFGMFGAYPERAAWLGLWLAVVLVITVRAAERLRGRPLTSAARTVISITVAVLYLKLLALLHPAKLPIDVVFHAHRLQWVLDGRFYFTQPMPSGVRFPYAIGLYIFAAPWTLVTDDYVLLLRIVVSSAEAIGALFVYLLVWRVWQDRLAGALAACLFHAVPRTFEIVGNANLTNAFGQSMALAVLTAAVLWPLSRRDWRQTAGLTLITAFALLSHISVFTTLGVILGSLALLYWWSGDLQLRGPAVVVLGSLAVAAVISIVVYYGHFGEAYRSAAAVRAAPAPTENVSGRDPATDAPATSRSASVSLPAKISEAGRLTVAAIGWPMMLLALAGGVPLWWRGFKDRLSLAIAAMVITFAVLTLAVVLTPVERSFQRYAAEFITRITLATYPAAVILAGLGAAATWRAGWAGRVVAGALLVAAADVGLDAWIDWLG